MNNIKSQAKLFFYSIAKNLKKKKKKAGGKGSKEAVKKSLL